ncbi:MAG: hypothetical protein GAK43_01259 [Stenotrophomonas maltophilia]|nr:MAG: hypothetical protein GAK43_01259 [Stenotrophomonas maltophilia]
MKRWLSTLALLGACMVMARAQALEPVDFDHGPLFELPDGLGARACKRWPDGRPQNLWLPAGSFEPERQQMLFDGQALAVYALNQASHRTLRHFYFKSQAECARHTGTAGRLSHQQSASTTYMGHLHFDSGLSFAEVDALSIECNVPGERYRPLLHVLLARLEEMHRRDIWMDSYVERRDGELRIVDQLQRPTGAASARQLAFEINPHGTLSTFGSIQPSALSNACSDGAYGRLWVSARD